MHLEDWGGSAMYARHWSILKNTKVRMYVNSMYVCMYVCMYVKLLVSNPVAECTFKPSAFFGFDSDRL